MKRLHNMGVRVSETSPEIKMAMATVSANSRNRRPTMPLMNMMGMNTATSDKVIDITVKPISLLPTNAACMCAMPLSRWRMMFSSTTMASSTTKPTARVRAMSERLSRLKPQSFITAKVPTSDVGEARTHRARDLDGVGAWLAFHRQHDRRTQVVTRSAVVEEGRELLILLAAVLRLTHVGEAHGGAVAIGDHQSVVGFRIFELAFRLQRITAHTAVERAGGEIGVAALYRLLDLRE